MIFERLSTSFRDSLSGLYSEAYFAEVFQREWHRMQREQDALSIIIIHPHLNVDNSDDQLSFKLIAEVVESATKRSTDIACRFQTNEIAIGVFNLNQQGTETVIKRILDSMPAALEQIVSNIDLSIGALNVEPNSEIDINDIFDVTEALADKAASIGKNSYQVETYRYH